MLPNKETSAVMGREEVKLFATADLFQLFSIIMRLPTEALSKSVADGTFVLETEKLLEDFDMLGDNKVCLALDMLAKEVSNDEKHFAHMRQAWTALFAHPDKPLIFPYESLFLHYLKNPEGCWEGAPRLFISPAALHADQCYKAAGFVRAEAHNESGDHISTELEYMAILFALKAESITGDSLQDTGKINERIEEFITTHLNKWAVSFFSHLAENELSNVYAALGCIAREFLIVVIDESTLGERPLNPNQVEES